MPQRQKLLRWFDAEARDLPWRRSRDPYAIWISEVMLQQTRVETVIPYYERFLQRFPDVAELARAPEDAVLSHWSGLGYYRRARQLHAAAKVMLAQHGAQVPRDPVARRALPGIGAYTAGAIGSIAFDLCEPIVDGNVARVLSRLHALDAPLGSKESEQALWQHAREWVQGERPGAFNQALMELGATVCTPVNPSCDRCPVQHACQARKQDRVELLPVPRIRRAPKELSLVSVRAIAGKKVYLLKSKTELFGGLYALPTCEVEDPTPEARELAAQRALAEAGLEPRSATRACGSLVHVLTHRRLSVMLLEVTAAPTKDSAARAFTTAQLAHVGVSTLTRRLLDL